MPQRHLPSAPIRILRDRRSKVAITLAASAMAAAILAGIGIDLPADAGASARGDQRVWTSSVAADGKIRDRHGDAMAAAAASQEPAGLLLLTPATIVMPMTLSWPDTGFAAPRSFPAGIRTAEIPPAPPPSVPRKALAPPERARPAADPAIMPAAAAGRDMVRPAAMPITSDQAMPVATGPAAAPSPSPIIRVGNAMSGAVGTVGAAGLWTLSQVSSLLPRP